MIRRLLLATASFLIARFIEHLVVYRGWIVPLLPGMRQVPWWMWALAAIPSMAICASAGMRAHGPREWLLLVVVLALADQAFNGVMGWTGQLGFMKSAEGMELLMSGAAGWVLIRGTAVASGVGLRWMWRRSRAALRSGQ